MNSILNGNTADVAVYMVESAATWWLQSLILLLIGLLVASSLRRRGPAVQSVVYRVTLSAVVLCPIASQLLTASGVSLFTIDLRSRHVAESPQESTALTIRPIALGGDKSLTPDNSLPDLTTLPLFDDPVESVDVDTSSTRQQVEPSEVASTTMAAVAAETRSLTSASFRPVTFAFMVLLATWLSGTLWFTGRILLAALRTQRLRMRSAPNEGLAQEVCSKVASQIGVRTPRVLSTPFLCSPCLLGHWRPAVLVPEETEPATYQQLFLHELAHLHRGDWLWNLAGQFVHALLWFQPLVWLLVRRSAAVAEDVCDDYVLEFGCNREGYLRQLLEIAERSVPQPAMGVSMVGFRSKLGRRAHRILDTSRVLSTRASRLFAAFALIATLFATATVGTLVVGQAHAVAREPDPVAERKEVDAVTVDDSAAEFDVKSDLHVTIDGMVLDPADEPVPNASLILVSTKQSATLLPVRRVLLRTKSDETGRFTLHTERQTGLNSRMAGSLKILAIKPGWGAGWSAISAKELQAGSVRVKLHQEKMISGRILDLEGRPVGGVRVAVAGLAAAKETVDLDVWHAKAQNNPTAVDHSYAMRAGDRGPEPFARFPAQTGITLSGLDALRATVTKPDGTFDVRGVARNHNATLAIAGKGVATTLIGVLARDMEAVNMPTPDSRFGTQKLYGANFDYAAHPSRVVRGRVVDKETRQALEGVLIRPTHTMNGTHDTDKFHSDGDGRFEIPILPARGGLRLRVTADHIPYFRPQDIEVPKSTGTGPIDLTIELERGEWIRGRLTNMETGEPITQGWVSYYPFFSNKRAEKLSHYRRDMMSVGYSDRVPVKSDGSYRIVGVPGRGIVLCGATNAGIFKHGAGAEKIKGLFGKKGGPRPRVYHLISVTMGNSVVEVRAKDRAGATCDITLEPLDRQRVAVMDEQRKPLTGYRVTGLLPSAMNVANPLLQNAPINKEASFEVFGLADAVPRTLLMQHPERKLARAVVLSRPKEGTKYEGDMRIGLYPAGTISGRVLATDGGPESGATAHLNYKAKQRTLRLGSEVSEDFEERTVYLGSAEAAADGTFSFDVVPPGIEYQLSISNRDGSQQVRREIPKVTAGQHVKLGELKLAAKKQQQGGVFE